jgi:hypothetical protein
MAKNIQKLTFRENILAMGAVENKLSELKETLAATSDEKCKEYWKGLIGEYEALRNTLLHLE